MAVAADQLAWLAAVGLALPTFIPISLSSGMLA
jgi:hypothetical protein